MHQLNRFCLCLHGKVFVHVDQQMFSISGSKTNFVNFALKLPYHIIQCCSWVRCCRYFNHAKYFMYCNSDVRFKTAYRLTSRESVQLFFLFANGD